MLYRLINGKNIDRKIRKDRGNLKILKPEHTQLVRQSIYHMYSQNEVPTLRNVLDIIRNEYSINSSPETLRKFLLSIGFNFKLINKRAKIMESQRIRSWRIKYLENIKLYREEGKSIYYLDETWYDTHDFVKRGWVDDNCVLDVPPSRGKRLLILHCGSADGWVDNALLLSAKNIKDCSLDYHQDMTADLFENWFEFTLIPQLPPGSVIVLDNASYHSRLKDKVPTSANNKEEIKDFLTKQELYFEDFYTKKQLLEVLKTKTFPKSYVIEHLAEKFGHTILRLPPYHCIFNPIELIWAQLKQKIRKNNKNLKFEIIPLIKDQVNLISPEHWKNSVKHCIEQENQYRKFWNNVQPLIINLDSSSTDEDQLESN